MSETTATIDRFEGDKAVLAAGGTRFKMPRTLLPAACREGDTVTLAVSRDGEQTAGKKQLAKDMLNEILHSAEE